MPQITPEVEGGGEDEPLPVGFWKSREEGLANWKKVQPLGCRTITAKTKARSLAGLVKAREALERKWAEKRQRELRASLGWDDRFPGDERVGAPDSGQHHVVSPAQAMERLRRAYAIHGESSSPWSE